MKFTSTLISLAALFSVAYADIEPVRPNSFYDNPQTSMNEVACSNGANGLVTKGYPTFGSLPSFPYIGGAYAVHNWNSTECGSCWRLTYPATGVTLYYTAIDTVNSGFDVSDQTMSALTKGGKDSEIEVESKQVAERHCGLPDTA